jgi:hypothetical protein
MDRRIYDSYDGKRITAYLSHRTYCKMFDMAVDMDILRTDMYRLLLEIVVEDESIQRKVGERVNALLVAINDEKRERIARASAVSGGVHRPEG